MANNHNARQNELKALEGLRQARVAKYSEALLKKKDFEKKQILEVKTLEEERKNVDTFIRSPTKKKKSLNPDDFKSNNAAKHRKGFEDWANGSLASLTKSPASATGSGSKNSSKKKGLAEIAGSSSPGKTLLASRKTAEKALRAREKIKAAKQAQEKRAKNQLAKLLAQDGEENSGIEDLSFDGVRGRYMKALNECKPKTIDVSHLTEEQMNC